MQGKIKILFFDDNPDDVELMKIELEKVNFKYLSRWIDTKEGFVSELNEFVPDVILCDYSMPYFDGMDAFKLVKELEINIPFIVVTGTINEELALDFLNQGVDDFILKSSFGRVPKSILKAIERKTNEKIIKQSEANLKVIFNNTSEGFILTDENEYIKSFNTKAEEIVFLFKEQKIQTGKSVYEFIGESKKQLMQNKAAQVLGGLTIQYDDTYKLKNGKTGWINFSVNFVKVDGKIKGTCITIRDVTELKLIEEKINNTNRMYAFISEINKMIVQVHDEQTLFRKVCRIAIDNGKFKMAWIGIINNEEKSINLVEECGSHPEDIKLFTDLPIKNEGPVDYILHTSSFYLSNEIEENSTLSGWKSLATKRGIRSCLMLPIKKTGKIIGTFSLYSPIVNFFDTEEIVLLEEVAENISFTLDFFEKERLRKEAENELQSTNKQLYLLSYHLQNIREEERTHIAREIHDELGQQLTALKMDIGWIKHKQKNPDIEIDTKLQKMLDFSDSLIKTIRRISTELRPAIIDDLGLMAALEWKCHDFEEKQGIPCNFISTVKERKFDSNFSITVFRILQETLTNVSRHAEATEVAVSLFENEKLLFMDINDNGKGFDNYSVKKGKTLGILGMKERASLMGGELTIIGEINNGTQTKLAIPL